MTFVRGMFVAAFMLLTVGSIGIHKAVAPLFASLGSRSAPASPTPTTVPTSEPVVAHVHRFPAARAIATPTTPPATSTPTASATQVAVTSTPTATLARHSSRKRASIRASHRTRRWKARRAATPTPTPQPSPTPTAISGTVALDRYWVGSTRTTRGSTFSVGYVIDNGTGHTVRVMLGASIKAARALSWLSGSIADPQHDVIAVVPPGVSTHIRYFTLPSRARPGAYDVAWGLRNAVSGHRAALVFAPNVLRVRP